VHLLRSVKNWLTLLFVAIVGVAALVTYAYTVPSLNHRLTSQKLADMRTAATSVNNTVPAWLEVLGGRLVTNDSGGLQTEIRTMDDRWAVRVVVVDALRDVPIADSRPGTTFQLTDYPMIKQAISSKKVAQGTVDIQDRPYAVTAMPVAVEDQPNDIVAVVVTSASLADAEKAVHLVERQIRLATAIALLVSLAAGYLASYFIARRLKRIERGAEAIAAGDLNATVAVRLEDEVGQLGQSFNTMGERLRHAFSLIEREKSQVELLLNDLSEGVIGVSSEGNVTIANPAAARLLGHPLPVGAELGHAFPYEVARIWYESREAGHDQDVVFEHGDRTLQAITYPVGSGADFDSILVLRDVTAQAKLERARRDFVANASHEFKTPLFSLSGFIELLDEGGLDSDQQREFLHLMRQQVDRLGHLSLSLLDLSQVEAGSVQLHPEDTDLVSLAQSVVREFQGQAATKDLAVAVEAPAGDRTAYADAQRLAQAVRALVDNAVKFTPQGGAVTVVVGEDKSKATLAVVDTGPGVADDELEHVFERFYRGSEDRANKAGTGLGLAIARELVELMGGFISAESKPGQGSRFTLRLPRGPVKKP
jgi:signal transduction histidine kinase